MNMRELKAMDEQVIKVMPAPPNPVQKEALSRLSRGPVAYLCADRAQGVLMAWNLLWQGLQRGACTRIIVTDAGVEAALVALLRHSELWPLCYREGDDAALIREKLTARKRPAGPGTTDGLPWQHWKRRQLRRHRDLQQNLFGERTYRILAQEWYRADMKGAPEILEARLDPGDFQFTPQEFYLLRGRIEQAETIFNPQLTRLHALENLNPRFFEQFEVAAAEEWLYDRLDEAAVRTRQLMHRLHAILATYKRSLQGRRYEEYAHFHENIETVRDQLEVAEAMYGEELYKQAGGVLKKSFSSRSKELDLSKKQLKLAYMELHRELESSAFGPYIAGFEDLSIAAIRDLLDEQERRLRSAWPEVLLRAQESQVRLNSQNMEGGEDQLLVIRTLEQDIEAWLQELNAWEIFARPIAENALSLPKKGEVLARVLEQLEEALAQMPRFVPFYEWRSFEMHLPEAARKLTRLLGEEHNGDWLASFEAWYYSQLLTRYASPVAELVSGDSLAALWWRKRRSELWTLYEALAERPPDGGWLTRLNQSPEAVAVVPNEDSEWRRLFPIRLVHTPTALTPEPGDITIGLFAGKAAPAASQLHVLGSDADVPEGCSRLYDPRSAWPDTQGVLQVKSADKIRGIKALAEALVFEIAPAGLFQSKDMVLLSKWPEAVEQSLLRALGKNMKTDRIETEEDSVALIEALLDNDRPVYLLTEENMLSRTDPIWDSYILDLCRSAGMKIIDINWQQLRSREDSWLEQLANSLKNRQIHE